MPCARRVAVMPASSRQRDAGCDASACLDCRHAGRATSGPEALSPLDLLGVQGADGSLPPHTRGRCRDLCEKSEMDQLQRQQGVLDGGIPSPRAFW